MDILGTNSTFAGAYPCFPKDINRTQKAAAGKTDFAEQMQKAKNKSELGNDSDEKKTENKTNIIVKPDGSRMLVVTMKIGGMETTMSIEISKPTNMLNDNSQPHKAFQDFTAGAVTAPYTPYN